MWWTIDTLDVYEGIRSAKSGFTPSGVITFVDLTLDFGGGATLNFWYRTSSATTHTLDLLIDGVVQESWGGETPWTQYSGAVPGGLHTIRWQYNKEDFATVSGGDYVSIDNVSIPGATIP